MSRSDFELRLSRQLRELAAANVVPIDPLAVAQGVVVSRPRSRWASPRSLYRARIGRLVWVAALVGALIAGLFAIVYLGTRSDNVNPTPRPTGTAHAVVIATSSPRASATPAPSTVASPSPAASFGPQKLALVQHGQLFLGDTTGLISAIGVSLPVVLRDDLSDFKAVRWSPDGSRLVLATGQQPGDPLWHGLALADDHGGILSWVGDDAEVAWAPDSSHLVVMPLTPITHGTNHLPFYASLDFFPSGLSGLQAPNMSGIQDLGIAQPGFPFGAGWQGSTTAVVALSDVVAQDGGYGPDPQLTTSVWTSTLGTGSPATIVATAHNVESVAISPDGSKAAFADQQSVTLTPLDGSPSCTLEFGHGKGTEDPLQPTLAWSPDGATIAVGLTNYGDSFLWTVASDCSSYSLIDSGTYTFGDTYSNVSVQPSAPPLRVSGGEFINGPIEWSADGQTLYYTAQNVVQGGPGPDPVDSDLMRISVSGGKPELVALGVESFDLGP